MAKRKSSKQAPKKKAEPLATTFKCLFCHHDKSVSVKMDKVTMFGHLSCKICGQHYTSPINNLSAPVDIYCDWVDACEEVRLKQPKKQRPVHGADPLAHGPQGGAVLGLSNGEEDEPDAEGEEVDPDEDERPTRKGAVNVIEEEEEVDWEGRRDKRRRIEAEVDEDDDDDDDD